MGFPILFIKTNQRKLATIVARQMPRILSIRKQQRVLLNSRGRSSVLLQNCDRKLKSMQKISSLRMSLPNLKLSTLKAKRNSFSRLIKTENSTRHWKR